MPVVYEAMRNSMRKQFEKRGEAPAQALKDAKTEAARTFNSRRAPGTPPVTRKG